MADGRWPILKLLIERSFLVILDILPKVGHLQPGQQPSIKLRTLPAQNNRFAF
jgi:hypothetical protein